MVPSRFRETLDKATFPAPYAYAVETAKHKALEVAQRLHQARSRPPSSVEDPWDPVALGNGDLRREAGTVRCGSVCKGVVAWVSGTARVTGGAVRDSWDLIPPRP